jgi:hypothetical protein
MLAQGATNYIKMSIKAPKAIVIFFSGWRVVSRMREFVESKPARMYGAFR